MIVGVLSDTHIPSKAKALPNRIIQSFKEVDHIIHAGDIGSIEVLDQLKMLAPVAAVCGNADPDEIKATLHEKEIITLEGYHIGIVHGHGKAGKTLGRAMKCFENDDVDCIVFGHSHIPFREEIDQVLLFNPGSPTDKRRNEFFSYGIIELGDGLKAKHVFFTKE
jgi:putative phosphoesterase